MHGLRLLFPNHGSRCPLHIIEKLLQRVVATGGDSRLYTGSFIVVARKLRALGTGLRGRGWNEGAFEKVDILIVAGDFVNKSRAWKEGDGLANLAKICRRYRNV